MLAAKKRISSPITPSLRIVTEQHSAGRTWFSIREQSSSARSRGNMGMLRPGK
ncbi:Uncharacterised protein [Vibrio cholerae]|nr:Uncharacterised protein [Vibrio cholerae]